MTEYCENATVEMDLEGLTELTWCFKASLSADQTEVAMLVVHPAPIPPFTFSQRRSFDCQRARVNKTIIHA